MEYQNIKKDKNEIFIMAIPLFIIFILLFFNSGIKQTQNKPLNDPKLTASINHTKKDIKAVKQAKNNTEHSIYSRFTDNKTLPLILFQMHYMETRHCIKNCSISHAGARGAMQFLPNTWRAYACAGKSDINNFEHSICGASRYMESLYKNEKSYNAGVSDKWIYWKALYRYNAGYTRHATHADGLAGGILYADTIINKVYPLD